ncbi:hypothetical protein [Sphingomonas faeni]|uniref:hypothetical protein n=1 Tax=Sphingomonas faeni TaxID=185950 RepID=UPI0020C82C76|nr:hypothetical protein [Sphingomonas faeni]MCP8893252.1 hypothetical protein [Sphingomonas faeni]
MSVFLGADLVGANYPDRDAFIVANAPTQIFIDKLKGLRGPNDGAVTHTNAAVGGSFDNDVPQQWAGATGKPFNLIILGLAMNSGSVYGVHGRGPNADYTKRILKSFIREHNIAGTMIFVCNTIHPWPQKFDIAKTEEALAEGVAYPVSQATLYGHINVTFDAVKSTMRIDEPDAAGLGFFDQAGSGNYIKSGTQLRIRQGGGRNDGEIFKVVTKIDGATLRIEAGNIKESGVFYPFVQHYSPDLEQILTVPPSKQKQVKDWSGSGVKIDGLASYSLWNSILGDICKEEGVKLIDLEYRGFRWAERYGWASVYSSSYEGVPFNTFNHPQIRAQKVIYGDMMRDLAARYNAGQFQAGFEALRGPAIR